MIRTSLAAALCVCLGGCITSGEGWQAEQLSTGSLDRMLDATASPGKGGDAIVVSMPRGAGRVVRVKTVRTAETLRQDIELDGNARGRRANRIDVLASRPQGAGEAPASADLPKPTEDAIRAELADRFPDVAMQIVTRPMHDVDGPIGVAIGKTAGGARCLYAWQWLDKPVGEPSARTSILALADPAPAMSISLRVELCRDHMSADALAEHVVRMSIRPHAVTFDGTTDLEASLGDLATTNAANPGTAAATRPAHHAKARRRTPKSARSAAASADPATDLPMPQPSASASAVPTAAARPLDPSLPARAYLGPSPVGPHPQPADGTAAQGPNLVPRPAGS